MTNQKSNLYILVRTILLWAGISATALSGSMAFANDCKQFNGVADIQIVGPLTPGVPAGFGVFTLVVGDSVRVGSATALVLDTPKYSDDGTIHMRNQLLVQFPEGDSVAWIAKQVFSPTEFPGEYRLNERIHLEAGTGIYSNSFAKANGHGDASFNTGMVHLEAQGKICDLGL